MKTQFWACCLALVLLLSGLAYIALTDAAPVHSDSEMVVLSDSEMAELSGTASDQRCGTQNGQGCSNSTCRQTPFGKATYGVRFDDCYWATGWECKWWGDHKAQVICRNAIYKNNCRTYVKTVNDTTSDCYSVRKDN